MDEKLELINSSCCNLKDTKNGDCCINEVGEMVQKLVRVFQLFERDQIKVNGFTTTQCYTILELHKNSQLSMNDLSEKMNLNNSTMTRILDNLVRDEFIRREKSEEDRRIVIVSLTSKGKESAAKLNTVLTDYYRKIIANIPEGEVDNILNSVGILLNAFDKTNPNCC